MDSNLPDRKKHRLSASSYATTDCEYSFTVCARHKRNPFLQTALADEIIESLLWTRQKYGWLLFCYCLMPDHLHFVCRLTKDDVRLVNSGTRGYLPEGVLDHLARFKSYTTTKSWSHGIKGKLWQTSSYDRILDMQQPFEEVAHYILENPQRVGLVKQWSEWPYSRIVDPWWT